MKDSSTIHLQEYAVNIFIDIEGNFDDASFNEICNDLRILGVEEVYVTG